MAAIELSNQVHAMGLLFLGTTQGNTVEVRNSGFVQGSLLRSAEGIFTIGLVEKVSFLDAACIITVASGTQRMISAQIQPVIPNEPDNNVLISAYDAAGDPADIGEVFLQIVRFPTIT